jgi:hypothetical protein
LQHFAWVRFASFPRYVGLKISHHGLLNTIKDGWGWSPPAPAVPNFSRRRDGLSQAFWEGAYPIRQRVSARHPIRVWLMETRHRASTCPYGRRRPEPFLENAFGTSLAAVLEVLFRGPAGEDDRAEINVDTPGTLFKDWPACTGPLITAQLRVLAHRLQCRCERRETRLPADQHQHVRRGELASLDPQEQINDD